MCHTLLVCGVLILLCMADVFEWVEINHALCKASRAVIYIKRASTENNLNQTGLNSNQNHRLNLYYYIQWNYLRIIY